MAIPIHIEGLEQVLNIFWMQIDVIIFYSLLKLIKLKCAILISVKDFELPSKPN